MFKIKSYILLFAFLTSAIFSGFSQENLAVIDYKYFNTDVTYAPGSGVSFHIDPKGVYELIDTDGDGDITSVDLENNQNNRFILELSSEGGSFNNPTVLSTVYDFYTPLINGVIPNNITAGEYRLRIRATKGVVFDGNLEQIDGVYDQPEVTTATFTIDNSSSFNNQISFLFFF